MSESATTDQELFTRTELEQFAADDVEAGSAIGKMLTLFFLYTIVVMSVAAWWTYRSVETNHGEAEATAPAH